MKTVLHTSILVALMAISNPASAETRSFRCKNDLISLGDGKAAALMKCGEPVLKDVFCKPTEPAVATSLSNWQNPSSPTTVIHVASCVTVDDWTYNPGYGQFMTTLRFESGKLSTISYGDRVK